MFGSVRETCGVGAIGFLRWIWPRRVVGGGGLARIIEIGGHRFCQFSVLHVRDCESTVQTLENLPGRYWSSEGAFFLVRAARGVVITAEQTLGQFSLGPNSFPVRARKYAHSVLPSVTRASMRQM